MALTTEDVSLDLFQIDELLLADLSFGGLDHAVCGSGAVRI